MTDCAEAVQDSEFRKGVRKMYTKEAFTEECRTVFNETEGAKVHVPGIGYTTLFEHPLIGFAAANDPLFEEYLKPEIIGPSYYIPEKWLHSAGTIVSFRTAIYRESPFQQQRRCVRSVSGMAVRKNRRAGVYCQVYEESGADTL